MSLKNRKQRNWYDENWSMPRFKEFSLYLLSSKQTGNCNLELVRCNLTINETTTLIILSPYTQAKKKLKLSESSHSSIWVFHRTLISLMSLTTAKSSSWCNILSSNVMTYCSQDFQKCLSKSWKSWTQTSLEFRRSSSTKFKLRKSQNRNHWLDTKR